MDEAMDERLGRLERECRRWRRVGIGMATLGALALIAGGSQQGDGPRNLQADRFSVGDLEARKIVLKDERGGQWFSLESRGGIPQMAFEGLDEEGKRGASRVQLVLNRGGVPYMSLAGTGGGGLWFGVSPAGQPHLSLSGKGGMITLGMGDDGSPQLMLWDKENRGRLRLRLKPDGSGAVEVLEEKDAPRLQQGQQAAPRD